jgi:hypothetical protein
MRARVHRKNPDPVKKMRRTSYALVPLEVLDGALVLFGSRP